MNARSRAVEMWLRAAPREERVADIPSLFADVAIARALGYGPENGRVMPAHVAADLSDVKRRAGALVEPRVHWITASANVERARVVCRAPHAGTLSVGGIVASQLRGCSAVVVFVVTIGTELERAARRMMADGDALAGYMLDALGSVAVEACVEQLAEQVLREVQPLGWQTTNRFSPGYCTWATADQHALFGLLSERPAEVALSASGLMQPIKSISGVIGIGAEAAYHPYPCAFCGQEDCHQRLVDARDPGIG